MTGNDHSTHWESMRERSTPFMLQLLLKCALLLGRRGVRPIVYCTVAYFFLTSPAARRISKNFLRRALHREPQSTDVWRHFFTFASVSVDRFFFLAGRTHRFQFEAHRSAEVLAIANRGKGCLLVMSHFGSFEVLRCMGDRRALPISILLDRRIGKMLTSLLERLNPQFAAHVIDASQRGPELVLALKETIERNRMVGIMGDRIRADDSGIRVQFMGADALLPAGPWKLAAALRVPVILGFGIYRGGARYEAHFELLNERVELPRASREQSLQNYAQGYADRLEHYARLAPYNWFNFYDFWQ